MANKFIITDDDGTPTAAVDMDLVTDLGTKLAFRLAAERDRNTRQTIAAEVLAEIGDGGFGYVCACAMQVLASEILHPALDVAAAAGADVRPGLEAIAEGRDPSGL